MKGKFDMNCMTKAGSVVAILSFIFLSGLALAADSPAGIKLEKPKVRVEAPAFTLAGLGGGTMSLSDFEGKVVILHFWATWCVPCRDEMPHIEKLWNTYKDRGLEILAVSVDRGSPEIVDKFIKEYNVSYRVLLDPKGDVRSAYQVALFPTTYIIGRDGRISFRIIGSADWEGAKSRKLMEALLK